MDLSTFIIALALHNDDSRRGEYYLSLLSAIILLYGASKTASRTWILPPLGFIINDVNEQLFTVLADSLCKFASQLCSQQLYPRLTENTPMDIRKHGEQAIGSATLLELSSFGVPLLEFNWMSTGLRQTPSYFVGLSDFVKLSCATLHAGGCSLALPRVVHQHRSWLYFAVMYIHT